MAFFFLPTTRIYSQSAESAKSTVDDGSVSSVPETKEKKESETKTSTTTITILNAITTNNKKDLVTKDDVISFEGDVKISVEQGETKTTIKADKITYNRARDMLFAEGSVSLEQIEKGGMAETATAKSLIFNTITLEGIFDDGRVVQKESDSINVPTGSTLVVASDLFARDDSGTIAFKDGELTFCSDENPHWRIKASRLWLLPGQEFAFLNAVLFVGRIPLLYLPAFYYPKDELVFNPVFGFKNRSGYYFQTSTYLYGRKPLEKDSASSTKKDNDDILGDYFSLIKPSKLKEQKLEGIVLHNLDQDYKGKTTNYFKLIADWYSNLGFAAGFDGVYKPEKYISNIEANLMLGFSNTVFPSNSLSQIVYTPYSSLGKKYSDSSNFMGFKTPFRYKAAFKFAINNPFSLSISIPIYSDPFFNYDFGQRSETMDWFSYLLNNPTTEKTDTTETQKLESAEITSFSWEANGSYSAKIADFFNPFITSLSISSLNSSIVFTEMNNTSITSTDNWTTYTPERKFFYPSQITPVKISAKMAGTIFSTTKTKKTQSTSSKRLNLLPSEELSLSEDKTKKDETLDEKKSENEKRSGFDLDSSLLPDLSYSATSSESLTNLGANITYSIAPTFTSQLTYASASLRQVDDFNWKKIKSSYISVSVPVVLADSVSFRDGFMGLTNSFTFNPVYQTHPYLSENEAEGGYSASSLKSVKNADYKASLFEIQNVNKVSFKPFVYLEHFKETGVSYNTSIKLFRTEFIGDSENPEWEKLTVDWTDKDSIKVHTLDFVLATNERGGDFSQSFTLTSTLPPQVDKYYGLLNLKFPGVTLIGETGISKKSATDSAWKKEPFKQSLSVSLFSNALSLTESYNYELEDNHPDALKIALSFKGLQAAFTMRYTNPYEFDSLRGWVSKTQKEFLPYSTSLAYTNTSSNFTFWKNRITFKPGISTSIVIDHIRPTNSYFIFAPSISFKINEALDITFSSSSKNSVLYRYFQEALGYPDRIPGEQNIFTDLVNSFRFDKESLRQASGFKLESLSCKITHDLHDWDLNMEFKLSPRLVTENNVKRYDFSPYFTISVLWRPMDSIKTKVVDKYGTWELNPSSEN